MRAGQLPELGPAQEVLPPQALDWFMPVAGAPQVGVQYRGRISSKPLPRDAALDSEGLRREGVGWPIQNVTPNLLTRLQALVSRVVRRPSWYTARVEGFNRNPYPLPSSGGLLPQNSAYFPFSGGSRVTLSFTERTTRAAPRAYDEAMSWMGLWAKAGTVGIVLPGGQISTPRPEYRRVQRARRPSTLPAVFGQ